ncbi:hypothetical protein Q5752_002967 [Cryptotrichosporon argae]
MAARAEMRILGRSKQVSSEDRLDTKRDRAVPAPGAALSESGHDDGAWRERRASAGPHNDRGTWRASVALSRRHGRDRSRERSSDRYKDNERREDKEDRQRRKDKKRDKKRRGKTAASTATWGKFGVISETDMSKRDSEFRAWLVEERQLNPEHISRERTRREFATFVEDFNTATLPHEKYYDMAQYEFKMNLIRTGQTLPIEAGGYDPTADMRAHTSSLKRPPRAKNLSRAEVEDLRRIQAERHEIGKRRLLGLDVPKDMGVRHEDALVVVSVEYRD